MQASSSVETAFQEIVLTITVDKASKLQWPRIETANEWITMGFDEDLGKALANAKSETAKLVAEQRHVSPEQAAALVSKTSDCRVTQVVDIKKGVHCISSKDQSKVLAAQLPNAETADYLVTYAANTDMNKAMDAASWNMIELLQKQKSLTRLDAYSLASMTMDCRVGEMDAPEKASIALFRRAFGSSHRYRDLPLRLTAPSADDIPAYRPAPITGTAPTVDGIATAGR